MVGHRVRYPESARTGSGEIQHRRGVHNRTAMRRAMNLRALALAAFATATCVFLALFPAVSRAANGHETWSAEDVALISSMRLSNAGHSADPSNVNEGSAEAMTLGRALFHDPG